MLNRDQEDSVVDFNDASLYLPLAQTVFSLCTCATVSVLACWLAPNGTVSAVRTLALCCATGGLLMRAPVRLGKAHGITVVFSALQMAVPLYLGTLVVEQLVHTCSIDATHVPSWRHVIFHGAVFAMACSGFMRARAPLEDTDRPFIITLLALMVIAIMPPPSVALVGPLCQSASLWDAADRIVRAFCFGMLYCITVYASTRTRCSNYSNTATVFFRSAAASIWVSGALLWWLPFAAAQCAVIMHARAMHNTAPKRGYQTVESSASTDEEDIESNVDNLAPKLADPVAEQNRLLSEPPIYAKDAPAEMNALVDLGFESADSPHSIHATPKEPIGKLPFQQVSLSETSREIQHNTFSASVAKAMAMQHSDGEEEHER